MKVSDITTRFNAGNPCPVCGAGSKGCSATADGLHFCRGEPADPPAWKDVGKGQPDAAGFRHYRRPAPPAPKSNRTATRNWQAEAERCAGNLDADGRAELAGILRLPVEAIDHLPLVGVSAWHTAGRTFTFPECDPAGRVLGLTERRPGGKKKMLKGGNRGLTLPTGWRERSGPVFIVEGASDTLAMSHAGVCCVGRPSNSGGADLLAELLADWPADRDIVVLGENDRKPNGDWPGKAGAEGVAKALAAKLGRGVLVAFPPAGAKDVREWLTSADRGDANWPDHGAKLAAALLAAPERIEPPGGGRPGGGEDAGDEGSGGVRIIVGTDEFRVNAEATAALACEPDIYQRGGLLAHVLRQDADSDPDAVVRRPAGVPVIRDLAKPLLRERLTRCARWLQEREGEDSVYLTPVHPPGWAVDAVHVRGAWPHVRRLEAVVTHPVVLPDGSILTANGYHRPSGILACVPSDIAVVVPETPTRADIEAAVTTLFDPLADFPFETPAHRAAWVAGLLTPLAWFTFTGPAPLFLIDANIRAAGKGLLADVAALTLTGRRFPVMTYTNDREELRKKITTAAVEGERLILLDNLAGAVGNDTLDAALTTDRWKDRLLGGNRMFDGPLQVTWFGTGNNVQLAADTSRRVCHVRLESADERPEMRDGLRHPDLRGFVRANRGRLLSAALTLLRGWFAAGRPKHGLKPWGSYEPWSDVVREAVVFAGLPDPGETRVALQTAADRDAGAMGAIIDGLARMDATRRGLTTADIVTKLKDTDPAPEWMSDMRSAVEDLCGKLDGRALGYKLRQFQRRNFGGRMVDKGGTDGAKTTRWAVFDVRPKQVRPKPSPSSPASPAAPPVHPGDAGDEGDGSARKKSAAECAPPPPPPVWEDAVRFYALMESRGWTWPGVVAWLKAAPSAVFFDVAADQRRRAVEHLEGLTPPAGKASKK